MFSSAPNHTSLDDGAIVKSSAILTRIIPGRRNRSNSARSLTGRDVNKVKALAVCIHTVIRVKSDPIYELKGRTHFVCFHQEKGGSVLEFAGFKFFDVGFLGMKIKKGELKVIEKTIDFKVHSQRFLINIGYCDTLAGGLGTGSKKHKYDITPLKVILGKSNKKLDGFQDKTVSFESLYIPPKAKALKTKKY